MQDPKTLKRWMAFQLTSRPNGTVDKQPLSVYGGFAASDDPATWGTYEQARSFCVEHKDCQLGFVLGEEVGLVVVDIDKARTSKDQEWPAWVQKEVAELDSFTEESVSGLGLHVWVWGSIPANMNRQKLHVELHVSKKMFVVTNEFAQQWEKIQPRDLTKLVARVEAGEIGPNYKPPIKAYAYSSAKFKRACDGDTVDYDYDNSRAVQGVLWTLARKHHYDEDKIRAEFEATKLCAIWEEKGAKWTRLGEDEIARAIKEVKKLEKSDKLALNTPLEDWKLPKVEGTDEEYVLSTANAEFDGWFPRGGVSIIAGPSGAGKTSLMSVLLHDQFEGRHYLGHEAGKYDFLTIFFDRKRRSAERTLKRLGLAKAYFPMEFCSVMWGSEAITKILEIVEAHKAPPVVFIEGGDLIVQKPNDISYVTPFVSRLQEISEHYHIAVIMSLGSPKKYEDRKVLLNRDNIFGSQVWGRMTETVAILTMVGDGDGTETERQLIVQHRDASAEKFDMQFLNGRLVPCVVGAEDVDDLAKWARDAGWFTLKDAEGARESRGWLMSKQSVGKRLERLQRLRKIESQFRDGSQQYRWKFGPKGTGEPEGGAQ